MDPPSDRATDDARSRGESVARGLREGRPAAEREVRQRVRGILGFRGFAIPRAEREEIEQEILMQIWQMTRKPEFDPAAGFWGLVSTVTTRRSIDWIRRSRAVSELEPDPRDPRPGPLRETLSRERIRLAERSLAGLSEDCRRLIRLRLREELSFAQISRRLGTSPGALRVRLHRCIDRVRREIGDRERAPEPPGGSRP